MKRFLFVFSFVFLILFSTSARADEGMWLPYLLQQLTMDEMHDMGLELTKEDIYDVNNSSLKDAIVIFGGGCTGEIISEKGLLLTNMHCGYGQVQSHSTVEHDYLKNGFWAKTQADELPNPGLSVKFLVRVDDVTNKVLNGITDEMTEQERAKMIYNNSLKIENEISSSTDYDAMIRSFYQGNQYYVLVYETYRDVRLVASPPVAIGDFGSLTDNWMWPRHKADFTMFRVYTAPDGSPAEYSEENIPLKPKHYLPVNLGGVKEGDFAMILGYPGSTDRYMTTYGIEELMEIEHPNRIKIRTRKLEIMNKTMEQSPEMRIKYAAKYKGTSNYWKYSIGQMEGFKRIDVMGQRKALEKKFVKWVAADSDRQQKYGEALNLIEQAYNKRKPYTNASQYLYETMISGPEFVRLAYRANRLMDELNKSFFKRKKKDVQRELDRLQARAESYFRDYDKPTDKAIAKAMFELLVNDLDEQYWPDGFKEELSKYNGNVNAFVEDLYANSIFVNKSDFETFMDKPDKDALVDDPGFKLANDAYKKYRSLYRQSGEYDMQLEKGKRAFMAGLMEMQNDKLFYPDANFTMRLTYGKVGGYKAKDAVNYRHYTTLKGVMEKEDPNNYEFIVPEKLKELYKAKDYGRYAYEDGMHVCFITDNDITGGNSGSPVMNGKGELIGLAFDGNWEGMTGDIEFEEEMQKTIITDIRYIIWLMDKYYEADRIVNELTIVE